MDDPTDLLGHAAEEAEELARRKQKREQLEDDFKHVLADAQGRRVLAHLLDLTGMYTASFTGEALSTAHREGRRSVGLELLADVMAIAPHRYVEMLQERKANG